MTFLSLTSESFPAAPVSARILRPTRSVRTSRAAKACAAVLILSAVTVPDAVAHAKWAKAGLILTVLQHRCAASFTA